MKRETFIEADKIERLGNLTNLRNEREKKQKKITVIDNRNKCKYEFSSAWHEFSIVMSFDEGATKKKTYMHHKLKQTDESISN